MSNIVELFPLKPQDARIRCLHCDADKFYLLTSWQVQCAKCDSVMPVIAWRFDVDVLDLEQDA